MNREIIFKAKRKDNGEWIEGYYVFCRKHHYILPILTEAIGYDERENKWIEIAPDTICQYTGLTDKNDKEIWENSILKLPDEDDYFKCEWDEDAARFVLNGNGLTVDFDNYYGYECEVVGNIFDNADLLEVEE